MPVAGAGSNKFYNAQPWSAASAWLCGCGRVGAAPMTKQQLACTVSTSIDLADTIGRAETTAGRPGYFSERMSKPAPL